MLTLAVQALRSHRARQTTERMAAGPAWDDTSLVFTTPSGKMINPSTSQAAVSKLTKSAGLGHWHLHELRHSTVSILSAPGVPLEQVADVVGHAPGSKMTGEVPPPGDGVGQRGHGGDEEGLRRRVRGPLASGLAPEPRTPPEDSGRQPCELDV